MKTIKVKLHLVATEDKSHIHKLAHGYVVFEKKLSLKPSSCIPSVIGKPQHLYFTSDEEIKEGDWYINQQNSRHYINKSGETYFEGIYDNCRKIVVSTDPKLTRTDLRVSPVKGFCEMYKPTKQLVEAYCKKPFDECLIEMEDDTIHLDEPKWQIKVNSYNEITCHPVVEKMYTREELDMEMNLLLRDVLTFQKDKHLLRNPSSNNIAQFVIDWTKENLK